MLKMLVLVLSFTSQSLWAECGVEQESLLGASGGDLVKIAKLTDESTNQRLKIAKINVDFSYGISTSRVGEVGLTANLKDGNLVSFTIRGNVGLFGMNIPVSREVSLSDLQRRNPIKLRVGESYDPIATILPQKGWTSNGGDLKVILKMEDDMPKIISFSLRKSTRGWVLKAPNEHNSAIKTITVRGAGYSLKGLHLDQYKFSN